MASPIHDRLARTLSTLETIFAAGDPKALEVVEATRARLQTHTYGKYEIGLLNAIARERAAVEMIFGPAISIPTNNGKRSLDAVSVQKANGRSHDVVISNVAGQGLTQTAAATAALAQQLPFLKTIILIGIAAGQPDIENDERDVCLGDIVIGETIIQYDHVKRIAEDEIECRGTNLATPSPSLLSVARSLKAEFEIQGALPWSWELLMAPAGVASHTFARPSQERDPQAALRTYKVPTLNRSGSDRPHIHIGKIGSANMLLKDGVYRDKLHEEHGTIAYEMEGAGVAIAAPMFDAQYIVVRGVCDYGDSTKDDVWQRYSALGAAAVAKQILIKL